MTYINIAIQAAKEAGKIHLKYFNTDFKISSKSSRQDRVTIADTEAEKEIVSVIKKNFPQHNILAEEAQYPETSSEYQWIIDPLDGTNNFSKGLPIFCVSIALAKNNDVILGVLYDPIREELFTTEKGKGSYLNNKKIQVSKTKLLKDALLVTGFYYDRGMPMIDTLEIIKRFFTHGILGVRRMGSAALDLCNIASGRMDGFWEFYLSEWDFAAGMLLIKEAGGKVTDKEGKDKKLRKGYIVASNTNIHPQMLKIINF